MSTGTLRRHRKVVVVEPKPVVLDAFDRSLPKPDKADDKKKPSKK